MMIETTIEVDYYRPADLPESTTVVLQSPISPERQQSDQILVRQDQGQFKNEVNFQPANQVVKSSHETHRTYAHGVLIRSNPDQGLRKGDRVWLTEGAPPCDKDFSVQTSIAAVNLRTWEPIMVELDDVFWIPKLRKIDCGEGEEELLTMAGPPMKRDRKSYLLAVVQRLRQNNNIIAVEGVELREILEQDSFKYQNLTALPDGERRISELFHRRLAAVAPTSFEAGLLVSSATPFITAMPQTQSTCNHAFSLVTPPPEELFGNISPDFSSTNQPLTEGGDDADVRAKVLELQRGVEAKKARRGNPFIPAGPPPADVYNLGGCCPTPYNVFSHTDQPSLEYPYPQHHYHLDHECPISAAHPADCVAHPVPTSVQHRCCETNAGPDMMMDMPGCGSVRVTGGTGTISMVDAAGAEPEGPGIPVEAAAMPFVPDQDLNELGCMLYGHMEEAGGGDAQPLPPGCYTGGLDDGYGGWATDESRLHAMFRFTQGYGDTHIGGLDDGYGGWTTGECGLFADFGLSQEHAEEAHPGQPCVLLSPPGPPISFAGGSPLLESGFAAPPPCVFGEHGAEKGCDVLGDWHFFGDDDFDFDALMELCDV